jgi:hypothetical protein
MPRFFQFNTTLGVDDTFNLVNRCIGIRGGTRYVLATPIVFNNGAETVACTPGPEEIAVVHLLLCYGRPTGAHCSFATVCFEGARMAGRCTKDYPADEVRVALGKDAP